MSDDSATWLQVVEAQFPDARHRDCDVLALAYDLQNTPGRYLRVHILNGWTSRGVGLQYVHARHQPTPKSAINAT